MTSEDSSLLLVIPCYHESGRLPPFLDDLRRALADDPSVTVQVIDDGSGEEEAARMSAVVENARKSWPGLQPLVCLPNNLGKGGAIYSGWKANAGATWLGFVDADGSVPSYEVKRLLGMARKDGPDAGALFGSRILMLGKKVQRRLLRHLLGRVYATLVSEMLNIPVYDSQCGLKILPARAFQSIEPILKTYGFAFDVEFLVALLDGRWPVREEPIDWTEKPGGKLKVIQDGWRMLREIWRIRSNHGSTSSGRPARTAEDDLPDLHTDSSRPR